eukprot:TRINITY_DN11190_c0_g1_i1.p1 TRINITY_DN11190_c0_g1~~TRINITY_DN11190_c0_g1_i1.p1  ORF type:complete len:294 (-),score=63.31 TRINITY_DN11190_c0_g1_i1:522-1346(-)
MLDESKIDLPLDEIIRNEWRRAPSKGKGKNKGNGRSRKGGGRDYYQSGKGKGKGKNWGADDLWRASRDYYDYGRGGKGKGWKGKGKGKGWQKGGGKGKGYSSKGGGKYGRSGWGSGGGGNDWYNFAMPPTKWGYKGKGKKGDGRYYGDGDGKGNGGKGYDDWRHDLWWTREDRGDDGEGRGYKRKRDRFNMHDDYDREPSMKRPRTDGWSGGGGWLSEEDRQMMKNFTVVAQLDKVLKPLPGMFGSLGLGRANGHPSDRDRGPLSSRFGANHDR